MEDHDVPSFGPPPKYYLESVDNALRLLSMFLTEDRLRVKDAAATLGVATGTAHRLLSMLAYRGYVTQDPLTRVYVPGSMLLSIGLGAIQSSDLRRTAAPYLDDLHQRLDETIQLATLHGPDVLFVDARESSKVLRVSSRAGTLRPAHCTSVGKALLAELPREQVLEIFPDEKLVQVTARSVGSRTELLVELETTRERGYALNFSEFEDGVGSAAAVVRNAAGMAVAAIGAGAPMSRLDDARMKEIGLALLETVGALGQAL